MTEIGAARNRSLTTCISRSSMILSYARFKTKLLGELHLHITSNCKCTFPMPLSGCLYISMDKKCIAVDDFLILILEYHTASLYLCVCRDDIISGA